MCGRSASTVRREGGLKTSPPYPYYDTAPFGAQIGLSGQPLSMTFSGLTSRWTIFASCALANASSMWRPSRSTSRGTSGPRRNRSLSVVPATLASRTQTHSPRSAVTRPVSRILGTRGGLDFVDGKDFAPDGLGVLVGVNEFQDDVAFGSMSRGEHYLLTAGTEKRETSKVRKLADEPVVGDIHGFTR